MKTIVALHGFLGLPSDWTILEDQTLQAIDLYQFQWNSLWDCAKQLNAIVQNKSDKPILMGYSLGGRLALHALIDRPELWEAAIIVSTHPGLKDSIAKESRLQSDLEWAKRFEYEQWESLMTAWNSRDVFSHSSFVFQRYERDYNRACLAAILRNGSLGKQDDLRLAISQLPMPILWVVGEKDKTYLSLAQEIALAHHRSQVVVVPGVGHRLPWEHPIRFKELNGNSVLNFVIAAKHFVV